VFTSDGFAKAKTGQIVAGTGLTRGALYYHFADKVALFDAVVEALAQELVARIQRAAWSAPNALAGLRAGCEEWLEAMADPGLYRLYLVEAPGALGLPRWREIDATYGGGSLRDGIASVLAERADPGLDLEPLTALLTDARNEAALWIADADDQPAARRAMRSSLGCCSAGSSLPHEAAGLQGVGAPGGRSVPGR
jgi:AcrR family transcriptional regulator